MPTIEWKKYTNEQKEAHRAKEKKENDNKTISQMEERDGIFYIMEGFRGDRVELKVPCMYHNSLKQSAEACIRDEAHCYRHSISKKEPWGGEKRPCEKCPPKK